MDSVSQLALGAAVSLAVMGRRTAVWKAALWGGIAGTLPDLDALVDFGDAVANMVLHRSHSHGLIWLALLSPLLAGLVARIHGERAQFGRWWVAMALALLTHPLLDTFTVYGTQLLQPLSNYPFGIGSLFIIDPAYTLPLLIGVGIGLVLRSDRGLWANAIALGFSCLYIAWSVGAQALVTQRVKAELAQQLKGSEALLITPAPLSTLLWRIVMVRPDGYSEGFYSLLDGGRAIRMDNFPINPALRAQLAHIPAVQRMAAFSKGSYKLEVRGNKAVLTDLRMGQEPGYVFAFEVAQRNASGGWDAMEPTVGVGGRFAAPGAFEWLTARTLGADVLPPR